MNCEFCNSPVHVWFDCPKKPDGWKPERLRKVQRGTPLDQPLVKVTEAKAEVGVTAGETAKKLKRARNERSPVLPRGAGVAPSVAVPREPEGSEDSPGVGAVQRGQGQARSESVTSRRFDKVAYQREYMRKWRAKKDAS